MCLKGVVDFKAEERSATEHAHLYSRFTNFAVGIFIVSAGLVAIKVFLTFAEIPAGRPMPGGPVIVIAIAVAAVTGTIIALRLGVLKLAGALTFSDTFTGNVAGAEKMYLAAAAILIVPPVLLYTGVNSVWDTVMGYVVVVEAIVMTIAFVVKTFVLFVRQKVSLLVWFLYLCIVEIFPVGFVMLVAVRNI
jgi:hypothetical protein